MRNIFGNDKNKVKKIFDFCDASDYNRFETEMKLL